MKKDEGCGTMLKKTKRKMKKPKAVPGTYTGKLSEQEIDLMRGFSHRELEEQWMKDSLETMKEIRDELRLLRKDVVFNKSKNDELKKEYGDKFIEKFMQKLPEMYKNSFGNVNLGKMVFPGMDLNEVKKNTAGMMKFMMQPEMLEQMPEDFKKHYFNIMNSIGKPNDPIYEEPAPPDPREPIHAVTVDPSDPDYDLGTGFLPCDDCKKPMLPGEELVSTEKGEHLHMKCLQGRMPTAQFIPPEDKTLKQLNPECPGCGKILLPSEVSEFRVRNNIIWHINCLQEKHPGHWEGAESGHWVEDG